MLIYKHSHISTKLCIEKASHQFLRKICELCEYVRDLNLKHVSAIICTFCMLEMFTQIFAIIAMKHDPNDTPIGIFAYFSFSTEFFPPSCWVLTGLGNRNFPPALLISIYSKFVAKRRALNALHFMIDIESQTTLEFISQMIIRCLHTFSNSLVATSECQLSPSYFQSDKYPRKLPESSFRRFASNLRWCSQTSFCVDCWVSAASSLSSFSRNSPFATTVEEAKAPQSWNLKNRSPL